MKQQGFSLIEVLVALLLATTLVLSLIQQQFQSNSLLQKLLWQEKSFPLNELTFFKSELIK